MNQLQKAAVAVGIRTLAAAVHQNAREKGFWERERNQGELVALMHSELSELLEGIRHGDPQSDHIPEFTAREEEVADLLIRALDYAEGFKLRVAEALLAKHEFNAGREHLHGKAF